MQVKTKLISIDRVEYPMIDPLDFKIVHYLLTRGKVIIMKHQILGALKMATFFRINSLLIFVVNYVEANENYIDRLDLFLFAFEANSDYLYSLAKNRVTDMGEAPFFSEKIPKYFSEDAFKRLLRLSNLRVREVVKLHSIIQWGLWQIENSPKNAKPQMKEIVYPLLMLLKLESINSEDIKKHINPYDIFKDNEFEDLLKQRDSGESIQRLAGQKANRIYKFGYCNYPNEISVEGFRTIEKTGSRTGVLIISENPITQDSTIKLKIMKEGNPGQGCIGFGVCDKSCLNICPFPCNRSFGPFIAYYTCKNIGHLNMGDVGDKFIPLDYDRPFKQDDYVNIVVDTQNKSICFGINDVMHPEKNFVGKKIPKMHLAIWLNDPDDSVQLIYEY